MKRILLFFLTTLLFSNCKKDLFLNSRDPCICYGEINCTTVYISVGAIIKNQNGQPIGLDDYYTIKVSTGEKINLKSVEFDSLRSVAGKYPILVDGQKSITEKCGTDFEFIGIKNGIEIVKQKYSIGHDCCHVKILSGDPNITIPD